MGLRSTPEPLYKAMKNENKETLLKEGYSSEQQEAVTRFDRDVCVFAGAGSGKTTLLVERFLYAVTERGVDPERILAITFTEKAANEMKRRLAREGISRNLPEFRGKLENAVISTIHSFCARILRENPIESGLDPFFQILGEGEAELLMGQTMERLFEEEADNPLWISILRDFGEENTKAALRDFYEKSVAFAGADDFLRWRGEDPVKEEMGKIFCRFKDRYEGEKRGRASYDFEDLLFMAYRLLSGESPDKRKVRSRYRGFFSAILVDEYQDTSPLQAKIIELLKRDANLFVVGDVQQSIYGFRCADPEVFKALSEKADRRGVKKIVLRENFRSRPEIISFVNGCFGRLFESAFFEPLQAKRRFLMEKPSCLELLCVVKDGERLRTLDEARVEEARLLAERIGEMVHSGMQVEEKQGVFRPVRYRDMAVLFQKTTALRFYEKELAERGIPYFVTKGSGFYEKQEVKDIVNFMTLLEKPDLDIPLAGVLRSPLVGITDDSLFWLARKVKAQTPAVPLSRALRRLNEIPELGEEDRLKLERFSEWLEGIRRRKDYYKVSEIIDWALDETCYEAKALAAPQGKQKAANVRKLLDRARSLEGKGFMGVEAFVKLLASFSEREVTEAEARVESEGTDAVLLSTVHAAKGLEFPVVFIADMGGKMERGRKEGFLVSRDHGFGMKRRDPVTRKWVKDETFSEIEEAQNRKESAEAKRLLYVAMTRAKEHLVLSGCWDRQRGKGPSSWMGIVAESLGLDEEKMGQGELLFEGVKIRVLRGGNGHRESKGKKLLKEDVFREALKRLETEPDENALSDFRRRITVPQKDYAEALSVTVTDLLLEKWEKEGAGREVLEEKDLAAGARVEEEGVPRNEYGVLFHKAMEEGVRGRKRRRTVLPESAFYLNPSEREEMEKSVGAFWKGPWGKCVGRAKERYPELPFIYKTPYGIVKGQMDLVFQDQNGEWVVLDYKTNRLLPSEKETLGRAYEFQLLLYALVFRKLYGAAPKRGVLYFSVLNEAWECVWTEADFKQAEEALAAQLAGRVARIS